MEANDDGGGGRPDRLRRGLVVRFAAEGRGPRRRAGCRAPGSGAGTEGPGTWSRAERSERELDVSNPPGIRDKARAFVRGGYVPEGRALVIEAAGVFATAAGDSNGHGEVVVSIRGEALVRMRDEAGPLLDWFTGCAVIRPGEERLVTVAAANSSEAELRLRGRFVPLTEADSIEAVPFRAGPAPAGAARAGGGRGAQARSSFLAEPRAVLQVRAGHGGGNPMTVNLLGRSGGYLRKMSDTPIAADTAGERERDAESIGFLQGGHIPRGKAFVVTRVDYEGRTTKGHGALKIRLQGSVIVSVPHQDQDDAVSGTWTGRVVVPAGAEAAVAVEAAWYSYVSATFTGEFEDLPAGGR